MSRLTRYNQKQKQYTRLASRLAVDNKLGKLEDLMEKYEIDSIEALEEIIKDYDDMAKDIVEMGLGVKVDLKDKSE